MSDVTKLRAAEPGELLQLVPYLLGFHPSESLVLVCLRERRVVCTARVDVAAVRDVEDVVALVQRLAASTRLDSLVAIVYAAADNIALEALALAECAAGDLDVVDLLWVGQSRWESLQWGVSGSYDAAGELATQAVYAGLSAAPAREQVASLVEPGAGLTLAPDHAAQAHERVGLWGRTERCRRLRALLAQDPVDIDAAAAALAAELVRDGRVRDVVLSQLTAESAPRQLATWLAVVQHLPDDDAALAPLGLAGFAAWVAGEGTLASAALQRGARIGYAGGLLHLLETINEMALPPAWWDGAREQLVA